MKVKALLFDFGGTLDADGVHWGTRLYWQYQGAGIAISRHSFDEAFLHADRLIAEREGTEALSLRQLVQLQVELQMGFLRLEAPDRAEQIVEGFLEEAKATIERNAIVLSQLAREYLLGVVSNFSGNLATVCHEFGLDEFFEVILDSKIVGIRKPDPRLFQLALEGLNQLAEDCGFVGDSFERDVVPAKSLGMRTLWLRGAAARPCPDPSKVDFTLVSLLELGATLENVHV